jgi:hypothetical protein
VTEAANQALIVGIELALLALGLILQSGTPAAS